MVLWEDSWQVNRYLQYLASLEFNCHSVLAPADRGGNVALLFIIIEIQEYNIQVNAHYQSFDRSMDKAEFKL